MRMVVRIGLIFENETNAVCAAFVGKRKNGALCPKVSLRVTFISQGSMLNKNRTIGGA